MNKEKPWIKMKRNIYAFLLSILMGSSLWAAPVEEDSSVWLIQEDFIKFAQTEVYENQLKLWMDGFKKSLSSSEGFWRVKKNFWPIYGLQSLDELQYIYFIPLKDTQALGDFFAKRRQYDLDLPQAAMQQRQLLFSAINFSVSSLHEYVKKCSCLPKTEPLLWDKRPFVHYWVFGVTVGREKEFEEHIATLAAVSVAKKSPVCWRTWRVMLGGDAPKYVIALAAATKEDLKNHVKQTQFLTANMKNVIRNQREGDAVLKPQLSMRSE